jgi:hypothetical protein
MANMPHQFKHRDVVRLLRAGSAGGLTKPTVEVHLPSGTKYVLGGSVPEAPPKKSKPLRADPAEGGTTRMAGKGDRTKTSDADAAGKQQPGRTGHKTLDRGSQLAEGGDTPMFKRQAADPAQPGKTGKGQSAATSASIGGIARPARPGSCGT